MADDLQEIGTGVPVFPLYPNWMTNPNTTIALARKIIEYRGTAQSLATITDFVPYTFDAGFTLYNKQDEYSLIDFFNERRGKKERFWIQHPKIAFELLEKANSGSTSLVCVPNAAESNYLGYERIYIVMQNGDIITRHITNVSYNEVTDKLSLDFITALDRDVELDGYWRIGRFLLVRFDEDVLSLDHKTDLVTEAKVRFYELVREYDVI